MLHTMKMNGRKKIKVNGVLLFKIEVENRVDTSVHIVYGGLANGKG